ncbi:uncharacterized protein LOC140702148 [Pogona vitticeps]
MLERVRGSAGIHSSRWGAPGWLVCWLVGRLPLPRRAVAEGRKPSIKLSGGARGSEGGVLGRSGQAKEATLPGAQGGREAGKEGRREGATHQGREDGGGGGEGGSRAAGEPEGGGTGEGGGEGRRWHLAGKAPGAVWGKRGRRGEGLRRRFLLPARSFSLSLFLSLSLALSLSLSCPDPPPPSLNSKDPRFGPPASRTGCATQRSHAPGRTGEEDAAAAAAARIASEQESPASSNSKRRRQLLFLPPPFFFSPLERGGRGRERGEGRREGREKAGRPGARPGARRRRGCSPPFASSRADGEGRAGPRESRGPGSGGFQS